jgi:HPt (histidine-containing phosphotransfer) domain-containing protein
MTVKFKPNVTLANAAKQIEKRMIAVGKERDKLDELIGELEQLKWNCEEAYDNLQRARDALSELV